MSHEDSRLVFVCMDFFPDDQAASQLFTDLMVRLAGIGVRVKVLCGFPMGTSTGLEREIVRRETFGGVEIVRCGAKVRDKSNLGNRALLYASFLVEVAWELVRVDRRTFVFGVTSPPFCAHLLWLTSRIARFRYGYMFLDIFPEALIALGRMKPTSPVARLWTALSGISYRSASKLAVLGRDMLPLLDRNYGIDPSAVTYIPHWSAAEIGEPEPFSENRLARELGLEEKFVVQYSGNMGLLHDIDSLVRAADLLRDDDRIHFLFIGKGRRRRAAEELARELKLSNITWLDFVPREQLRETLSCCHAALISLREGMEGIAVPSKLYGILAAGRAAIAQVPYESEIAYAVQEEHCGLVVPPGNPGQLARAIDLLATDPVLARWMGKRACEAYREKYTIGAGVEAFVDFLKMERREVSAVH